MATATNIPPITVDQYEAFEGYPGLRDELIRGKIVLSPQPKPLHQEIAHRIERLLARAFGLDGTYVARQNSNVKFPLSHTMPAPDVFVVTLAAWNRACETDQYLSEPPVLVVEVISPANRRRAVEEKMRVYLEEGVSQVWIIQPKHKTVRIYQQGDPVGTFAISGVELVTPLQGSVAIDDLFLLHR